MFIIIEPSPSLVTEQQNLVLPLGPELLAAIAVPLRILAFFERQSTFLKL